jgi:hypothetical protein
LHALSGISQSLFDLSLGFIFVVDNSIFFWVEFSFFEPDGLDVFTDLVFDFCKFEFFEEFFLSKRVCCCY